MNSPAAGWDPLFLLWKRVLNLLANRHSASASHRLKEEHPMQLASLMLIAASYLVDSSHTTVGFAVKHMMVATVRGQFDTVAGKVEIDDADLTRCRIDVTIEAASVDTRNAKRDQHLRGADFFDVAKYPFITFKSSHFEKAADGRLLAIGNLT